MENIRITSKFMNGIIGKIIQKNIKKKVGYDISFKLNSIDVAMDDTGAHLHIDADADMDKTEFNKLLKNYGI